MTLLPVDDFLDQFVVRSDDVGAKARISRALTLAFPDPSQERELTHARAALSPIHEQLVALAKTVVGDLPTEGRKKDEPFLTVAIEVARTEFHPRIEGYQGRRQCFRALVELITADPREIQGFHARVFGAAVRDDLEIRSKQGRATSIAAIPAFASVLELVRWFDDGGTKSEFAGSFRHVWDSISRKLRYALFNPVPPPNQLDEDDEESEEEGLTIPPDPGIDPGLQPNSGWIPPEPTTHAERIRSPGAQEIIFRTSLSTITPLSKFTESSTTVLTEAEIKDDVLHLLKAADAAHEAHDLIAESLYLARALVPATATLHKYILSLTWDAADRLSNLSTFPYPGILTPDGEWLIRPELLPYEDKSEGSSAQPVSAVWIPLPRSLGSRLLRLHNTSKIGSPVFAVLAKQGKTVIEEAAGPRPSLSALRRTLVSRLMRTEPLGITGAQWVACDDFGLDRAPLHYDRFEADRLASIVARITFPWYGEHPTATRTTRPSHMLGSRRVPDLKSVQAFYASLREPDLAAQSSGRVATLKQRTRNLVHGLAAFSGHRPNKAFGELTLNDFGIDDPAAMLSDKKVSVDWRTRPVAVPKVWRNELKALLGDLAEAARVHADQPLGKAAESALAGTKSIFLDVVSENEVHPFGLDAYRLGMPDDLRSIDNFARQLLNSRLIGVVPEALRVGQMGWHGTREGAWADGSPWSVLSAAAALEKPLTEVLRDVGWRPLSRESRTTPTLPLQQLAWLKRETEHRSDFRRALSKAQKEMAARHAKLAKEKIIPRLAGYVLEHFPRLRVSTGGRLDLVQTEQEKSQGQKPEPVSISAQDSRKLLEFLAAGNFRSEEALVARNLISALIRDARTREPKIVEGPIPRRAISRWPNRAGTFASGMAQSLRDTRVLDELVCATSGSVPEAARVACALLLHGAYPEVEAVLAAMTPGSTLRQLESEPGVLVVEPNEEHSGEDLPSSDDEGGWMRGCLAYHGLAALHLWRWHRGSPTMPSEPEIDEQIHSLLPSAMRPMKVSGTLREVAALARSCNALRMDGWARLVGTGITQPVAASVERVVTLRDGRPMGPTRVNTGVAPYAPSANEASRSRHPRSLLDRLYSAIGEAVEKIDLDTREDAKARKHLRKALHEWLQGVTTLSSEGLLVRYVVALLDHGGKRRGQLEVRTIRNYVQAIGRPLANALPENPLYADSEEWEAAYESVAAGTSKRFRRARTRALARFHWTLSQEFEVPQVSFARAYALCDGPCDLVDVGFLSDHEVQAVASMLERDVASLASTDTDPRAIHAGKARQVAFGIALACALRPGEVERLQEPQLQIVGADASVEICKTAQQRLKSLNARRRTRFRGKAAVLVAAMASRWVADNRVRYAAIGLESMPLFQAIEDPKSRLDDSILFARTAQLLRWATGSPRARPYWLRKTAVRVRLEQLQQMTQTSLWSLRDVLAEIGHGEPTVTLNSYTHDPVTPLLRWFRTGWDDISAKRLATASGRSLSAVARRRGGPGLTNSPRDSRARIAVLLESLKTPAELAVDSRIELPEVISSPAHEARTLQDIQDVLMQISRGTSLDEICHAWSWSRQSTKSLDAVLNRLEAEFNISIRPKGEDEDASLLRIVAPRRLSNHGGVSDLMTVDDATPVLAEMADNWLRASQVAGAAGGVPCTLSAWNDWTARLPALRNIHWKQRNFGRSLQLKTPEATGQTKVCPWPILRWLLLAAWVGRAISNARLAPP